MHKRFLKQDISLQQHLGHMQATLSLHCVRFIQILDDLGALEHRCASVGILNVRDLHNIMVHDNLASDGLPCKAER